MNKLCLSIYLCLLLSALFYTFQSSHIHKDCVHNICIYVLLVSNLRCSCPVIYFYDFGQSNAGLIEVSVNVSWEQLAHCHQYFRPRANGFCLLAWSTSTRKFTFSERGVCKFLSIIVGDFSVIY